MKPRTLAFIYAGAVAAPLIFTAAARAADYGYEPAPPIYYAPPPPPIVVEPPPVSQCHVQRDTEHDDILGTNDWHEREVCDVD